MSNIMIVEDEGLIALEIQEILENLGYTVPFVITRGEEAIDKAITHKPDLILMDIFLQGDMDGIEAAMHIHNKIDIPIIYITAYSEKQTVERAKITTPYGYILKPVNEKELQIAVKMALYNSQSGNALLKTKQWIYDVLENIHTGVIITDSEGSIIYANGVALELIGYDFIRIKGKYIFDVLYIIDDQGSFLDKTVLNNVVSEGTLLEFTKSTVRMPDKSKKSVSFSLNPIFRENGEIGGIKCLIQENMSTKEDVSQTESFFGHAENVALDDPIIKEKQALHSYLEVEIAMLTLMLYDGTEGVNSKIVGRLEAYKNVLRYYFGEWTLKRLEVSLER